MNLNTNFNTSFNGVFEKMKASAPAAASGPAAPAGTTSAKPAPSEGATPTESLTQTSAKTGKATANMSLFDSPASLKGWTAAGKGEKIPLASSFKDGRGTLNSLMKHVMDSPKYSSHQKENFKTFLQEFSRHTGKQLSPVNQHDHIQHAQELLARKGISENQLDMILDGSFTAEHFTTMLNEDSRVY